MSNQEIKSIPHAAGLVVLATAAGAIGGWFTNWALIGAIAGFVLGIVVVVRSWPKSGL